jgi:emp24/gp25L/p24 family/GOLD.
MQGLSCPSSPHTGSVCNALQPHPNSRDNYMSISVYFVALFFIFQRVHLDIQVGEHAVDYANVAQKDKLSELQLRIRQLLDQVEQITKEQNYQRVSFDI